MRQDLADLVNSKLGLAGLDIIGHIATLFELFLGLDLIRYAEAFEQLLYVDAARAAARGIDEAYRLCGGQCFLESFEGRNVSFGRAGLPHAPDAHASQVSAAAGNHPALAGQPVNSL